MKTFVLQMELEEKQGLDQHGTRKMNIVCVCIYVYMWVWVYKCMSSSVLGIICDFYLL